VDTRVVSDGGLVPPTTKVPSEIRVELFPPEQNTGVAFTVAFSGVKTVLSDALTVSPEFSTFFGTVVVAGSTREGEEHAAPEINP
jgi:hypothetical protein